VANNGSNNGSSDVTVIDGSSNITATVTAGTTPIAVAVNPTTNKIYVANNGGANVTVIDGSNNTTATVAAGTNPIAVAVDPMTNKIYVANKFFACPQTDARGAFRNDGACDIGAFERSNAFVVQSATGAGPVSFHTDLGTFTNFRAVDPNSLPKRADR